MPRKLTGRNGRTVTIPDGGRGLQGKDGHMVAIPKGGRGLEGSDGRMAANPAGGARSARKGWTYGRNSPWKTWRGRCSWSDEKQIAAKHLNFCSGSCVTSIAGPNGAAQLYER